MSSNDGWRRSKGAESAIPLPSIIYDVGYFSNIPIMFGVCIKRDRTVNKLVISVKKIKLTMPRSPAEACIDGRCLYVLLSICLSVRLSGLTDGQTDG